MDPMNQRSAMLSAAAQRLAKPKAPGGQQIQGRDVTIQNGQTGITGAHGGFQQLGQAAQAKLRGFGGGPTPPTMDPAQKPPAWQALQQAGIGGQGSAAANRAAAAGLGGPPGGPNVFHPTNPAAGSGIQIMDGAPGTAVPPGGLGQDQNPGAPAVPFGGRPPSFGTIGQNLGIGGPQDEVQAAQHMGASIPPGVADAMRQQQMGGGGGVPNLGPVTNYGPANVDGGMPPPGPLGSMPGPSQKPLLRGFGGSPGMFPPAGGLPTKPLAMGPPQGGSAGSIWNRIAGGGGFTPRPTQLQRNKAVYF